MVPAYAKINLSLEVLGRRADGYHEIVSVMQAVELHDEMSFALGDRIALSCDEAGLVTERNLAARAAHLLRARCGTPLGASISLTKRIPLAAGLGGGSSDAAATLKGLHRLWRSHLSGKQLLELATQLGSDVPFFFHGPTALAEGRGERLSRLPCPPAHWVVLIVPEHALPDKTSRLYQRLTPADFSRGEATFALADALNRGQPVDPALLVNAFERAAFGGFTALAAYRDAIMALGAPWVRLSGSGPALYTFFEDEASARALAHALPSSLMPHATVLVTRTLGGDGGHSRRS